MARRGGRHAAAASPRSKCRGRRWRHGSVAARGSRGRQRAAAALPVGAPAGTARYYGALQCVAAANRVWRAHARSMRGVALLMRSSSARQEAARAALPRRKYKRMAYAHTRARNSKVSAGRLRARAAEVAPAVEAQHARPSARLCRPSRPVLPPALTAHASALEMFRAAPEEATPAMPPVL